MNPDRGSHRKTEALIDLDAIRENYALACALAPKSKNIAVIKANAYGHGLVAVAKALQAEAPAFAVAVLEEALELRHAGISVPLLILEGVSSVAQIELAAAKELSLVVHSEEQVSLLQRANPSAPVSIWLKVDTGMHRLGVRPSQVEILLGGLQDCACEVAVICTHLACADDLSSDVTNTQLAAFAACSSDLDIAKSIANSAGILAWPQSHADWNRPGYLLYGVSPLADDLESARGLKPAMSVRSEIISIREVAAGDVVGYGGRWQAARPSVIGTVAIGYADGYPRHAAAGTPTVINGRVAPLVGAVSMDLITVDLTEHENVAVGDSVELWGNSISVNEVAALSDTIGYELLTAVSARVPRRYSNER